jgi:hypothetical protein
MIRYTVLWSEQAEDELAILWSQSPQRREITQATDFLDSELQTDAHRKGVLHTHNLRAISRASVTLYFRVDEADRKVFVEAVRLTESN